MAICDLGRDFGWMGLILQVPVPETPLPTLPETTMLGKAQPPTLKICEAIVGDEGEVSDAPGEDCLLGHLYLYSADPG